METSNKPTASPSSTSHLFVFARLSGLLVAVLVLVWGLSFRSNFLSHTSSTHDAHMYSVLHVLVMVIGFALISGEAILVHKWFPGSRNLKKLVHLTMQGVALASATFGIWTKFHLERGVLSNFYSLHSWMDLICISLFAAQTASAISFGDRDLVMSIQSTISNPCDFKLTVVNGVLYLLASTRGAHNEDKGGTMACVPWALYICISHCNG